MYAHVDVTEAPPLHAVLKVIAIAVVPLLTLYTQYEPGGRRGTFFLRWEAGLRVRRSSLSGDNTAPLAGVGVAWEAFRAENNGRALGFALPNLFC